VLAQAAPARTRAHCRPTSLARLHECKPYAKCSCRTPRSRAAAAAQRQHGRTCTPAQAPVPQDARPAQHVATQCNMLQHAATQRNVCALHQRRSRCRRMRGLCGAFDMARPRRAAARAQAQRVHGARGGRGEYSGCIGLSKRRQAVGSS
jgi:hypothetical protein